MRRILAVALLLPLAPLAAQSLKPGQWELTSRVTHAVLPGAPPQMAEGMKAKPHTGSRCVTAEQATNAPETLMKEAPPSCKVAHFTKTGNRIDTSISCQNPQGGGSTQVAASGTFAPTSFGITSHTMITQPKGPPAVIDATISGRWTGTCTK